MRTIHLQLYACLALLISCQVSCYCDAIDAPASGDYVVGSATTHWEINRAHSLIWGATPYIPAGGVFQPRYLASAFSATSTNWDADVADLKALQSHGVTQLLLAVGGKIAGSTPITAIPPSALQRILDYLEANGFTYGLDVNGAPPGSVTANVINPTIYRQPAPIVGATATISSIQGLESGAYFIASSQDGSVVSHGSVTVQNSMDAVISIGDHGGDGTVLLVYPKRLFDDSTVEARHCPDIWGSRDQLRDDMLTYFSHIRFGKGLRFFVDPIRDDMGFFGAAGAGMIPSSNAYVTQFGVWLSSKYGGRLPVLERAWALKNEDLPDISTVARSIPLWYQAKGIQALYDPANDKTYDVNATASQAWSDIKEFQRDSMQAAMNGMADALKKGVADVPVIYRYSQASSVTLNRSVTGFDGLMIDSSLHGDALIQELAGDAVSDVEHADRAQWLTASLTPTGPATAPADDKHALLGYGSREKLANDRSILVDVGVRGFYIDALHRNARGSINLLDAPTEQLDWIHGESAELSVAAKSLAAQRATYIYYPSELLLPGAHIEELSAGVWWLPAVFDSTRLDLGPRLEGYATSPEQSPKGFIVYSSSEDPQKVKFKLPDSSKIVVSDFSGKPVKLSSKNGSILMTITSEPLLITGVPKMPLPDGAVTDEVAEVQRLIKMGKDAGAPTDVFAQRLYYIQNDALVTVDRSQTTGYELLRGLIDQLKYFVSPYIYIEGEAATAQTFGSVIASDDASGGAYLWMDNPNPPANGAYSAQYSFSVTAPGDYDVWASLAPTSDELGSTLNASAFTVTVDSGTVLNAAHPTPYGDNYASLSRSGSPISGQFVWCRLTTTHLTPGDHTIMLSVTDPSHVTGRWILGVDALCLSRGDFKPDGARPPEP